MNFPTPEALYDSHPFHLATPHGKACLQAVSYRTVPQWDCPEAWEPAHLLLDFIYPHLTQHEHVLLIEKARCVQETARDISEILEDAARAHGVGCDVVRDDKLAAAKCLARRWGFPSILEGESK